MGIKTKLIAGPSNLISSKNLQIKKVISAKEMMNEVKKSLPVDIAVCAAAVSDYKPKTKSKSKTLMKRKKTKQVLYEEINIKID